jgi:hypothetical protein
MYLEPRFDVLQAQRVYKIFILHDVYVLGKRTVLAMMAGNVMLYL